MPLHRAMLDGISITNGRSYFAVLDMLLEHGADPNAVDVRLQTPLHMAAAPEAGWNNPSDVEFIKALLEGGGDAAAVNHDGDTAYDVARQFEGGEGALELLCP